MKQRSNQNRHPYRRLVGQSGFTLIETVVVIVIMGAIAAAAMVNWSSFMRHQELRADAVTLHKEIVALKARAIEQDTIAMITIPKSNANKYTVRWFMADTSLSGTPVYNPASKEISLNGNVTVSTADADKAGSGLGAVSSNSWRGGSDNDTIKTQHGGGINVNIDAFSDGWIVVKSVKAKARYCIQKDNNGIRPELYYQSKAGAAWIKM